MKSKRLLFSVDMDDISTFSLPMKTGSKPTSILDEAVDGMLPLFDRHRIKATFFFVAIDEKVLKHVIPKVMAAGHEIANHSLTHRYCKDLTEAERTEEIVRSTQILEEIGGQKVVGYRAPGLGYDALTLRLLEDHAYLYDASGAVSPFWALIRAIHGWKIGRPSPSYGTFAENFGAVPETGLYLYRRTTQLMVPFYGTMHFYPPMGRWLFDVQRLFCGNEVSYITHAIDYVKQDFGIGNLRKSADHWGKIDAILGRLAAGRESITMAENARRERGPAQPTRRQPP